MRLPQFRRQEMMFDRGLAPARFLEMPLTCHENLAIAHTEQNVQDLQKADLESHSNGWQR